MTSLPVQTTGKSTESGVVKLKQMIDE